MIEETNVVKIFGRSVSLPRIALDLPTGTPESVVLRVTVGKPPGDLPGQPLDDFVRLRFAGGQARNILPGDDTQRVARGLGAIDDFTG